MEHFKSIFFSVTVLLLCSFLYPAAVTGENLVIVGSYTSMGGKGIHVFRLNEASGGLSSVAPPVRCPNPSYLVSAPNHRVIYAVSETAFFKGVVGGAISAYAIAAHSGKLSLINRQPTGGAAPCHVGLSRDGQWAWVANYNGGSVAAFRIRPDGGLDGPTRLIRLKGAGVHPTRQQMPHPHAVVQASNPSTVFVPDLGTDTIYGYRTGANCNGLCSPPGIKLEQPAGSGPRHLVFHPRGGYAFLVSELNSTVTVFRCSGNTALSKIQAVSSIPTSFKDKNASAAIHLSPSGGFLYVSNRGHDSIAAFGFDPEAGQLGPGAWYDSRGNTPRDFAIDPEGRYLLAANQDSGNIAVFKIDRETGALSPTGKPVPISAPACIAFVPEP